MDRIGGVNSRFVCRQVTDKKMEFAYGGQSSAYCSQNVQDMEEKMRKPVKLSKKSDSVAFFNYFACIGKDYSV